jgi:hypothetical protein
MKSFKLTRAAAIAVSGLILSTFILILFHASWGFLVTAIVLTMYLFSFKNPVLNSFSARAIISLLAILASFQVEALLFAVLHVHVNALVYTLIAYIFSFAGVLITHKRGARLSLPKLSAFDAIILVPAVLISGLYTARVIAPKEDNATSIIRSMTLAADDSMHFSMYEDLLRSDSNLLSFTKDNHSMALQQQGYPMGWHLSGSVITGSVSPDLKNSSMNAKIVSYFALKVMSFFLIIFVITLLVWQLAMSIIDKSRRNKASTVLGLYFIVAFSTFFTALPQFFEGFFSFLPIILYSLLFTLFAIELSTADKNDQPKVHAILIISILCAATCWLLTFPVFLVAYIFMQVSGAKRMRDISKANIIAIAACVIVFLLQCYILITSTSKSFSAISAPGGITVPDFTLFTLLNIFLVFFAIKQKFESIFKPLFVIILSLYLIMAPILAYISLKSQVITYYFQKMEVLSFVILVPVALVTLFMYVQRLELTPHQRLNNSSTLVALAVLVVMTVPSVIGYTYFVNIVNRVHGYQLSHQDARILEGSVFNKRFGELSKQYYFYYPNSLPSSILASNIARVGYFNEGCQSAITNAAYGDASVYSAAIKTCKDTSTITLVTDKAGEALLKRALLQDKVNISNIHFTLTD